MKKMYFLTAVFQNKFGKAIKYYDEKGWHWMLASDKPKLYATPDEAKAEASELSKDILSEISIREIPIYQNLWEHKIEGGKTFSPQDVFHERIEGNNYIFLSFTPQSDQAKKIDGLYRIDRKNDQWIYGTKEAIKSDSTESPELLIKKSYQKLTEAKALMLIFDYPKTEIAKVEGVMVFVQRLLKGEHDLSFSDSEIGMTPETLFNECFTCLNEAKNIMKNSSQPKTEIAKVEGVMIFVQKLFKS
jgi:hypothetical protein